MALVGYARVSSVGQSLAVQVDKLAQCHKLFQEKQSGVSGARPQLRACLEYVREGDTLVVTRLDRLARSTLHLCQIAAELARKQVHLQVLDQQITTMMQRDGSYSICWARLPNSRRSCGPSGRGRGYGKRKNGESSAGGPST